MSAVNIVSNMTLFSAEGREVVPEFAKRFEDESFGSVQICGLICASSSQIFISYTMHFTRSGRSHIASPAIIVGRPSSGKVGLCRSIIRIPSSRCFAYTRQPTLCVPGLQSSSRSCGRESGAAWPSGRLESINVRAFEDSVNG